MYNTKNIDKLIKEFDYGKDYPSRVTKPANNYIRSVKSYGWGDKEFVNGYQLIKWVSVSIVCNNITESVWHFKTAQEVWNDHKGKIGYIVNSWLDNFERQVSKEDGNTAYLMILKKAKEIEGAKIVIETII